MKKRFLGVLSFVVLLGLSGCGGNNSESDASSVSETLIEETTSDDKIITTENMSQYLKVAINDFFKDSAGWPANDAYHGVRYDSGNYAKITKCEVSIKIEPTTSRYDYNDVVYSGILHCCINNPIKKSDMEVPFEIKLDIGGSGEFRTDINLEEVKEYMSDNGYAKEDDWNGDGLYSKGSEFYITDDKVTGILSK